ncbi:MAG: outer membrane beta-barrel protein [bacterium]
MNKVFRESFKLWIGLLFFLIFTLSFTFVHAQGNIKMGGIEIHPALEMQMQWDDNIYNTPTNAVHDATDDIITTITPGLSLSMGTDYKFGLGYSVAIHRYLDNGDEDYEPPTYKASMALNFPTGLKVTINDTYIETKDTRTETDALRTSHSTNTISGKFKYTFPADNLSCDINISEFLLKYDQEANETVNRKEDSICAALYYRFLPKTSLFAGFGHTIIDYIDSISDAFDKDSKTISLDAGLKWEATCKITGTLKCGYTKKTFDNPLDASGNPYNNKEIGSSATNLGYNLSETTTLNFGINRSLGETEYGGSASDNISKSAYYTNTGYMLGISLKFINRINLALGSDYQNHKYNKRETNKKRRRDEAMNYNIGLTYQIRKWLCTSLKYTYKSLDSNDNGKDQINNKALFSIAVSL